MDRYVYDTLITELSLKNLADFVLRQNYFLSIGHGFLQVVPFVYADAGINPVCLVGTAHTKASVCLHVELSYRNSCQEIMETD